MDTFATGVQWRWPKPGNNCPFPVTGSNIPEPIIGYNVIEELIDLSSSDNSLLELLSIAFPKLKRRGVTTIVDLIRENNPDIVANAIMEHGSNLEAI